MRSLPFEEQIRFPQYCAHAIRASLGADPETIVPIGFDTEFDSSVPFTAPKLVLVQMCVNRAVYVFTEEEWAAHREDVRDALDDERVVVCGRGVLQDLLISDLCLPKAACLDSELGHPWIGLYDQVNAALSKKKRIEKDKEAQVSFRHGQSLTPRQLKYAATDAYVSLLLWTHRDKLNLWKPFRCPDAPTHERLGTIAREMHAREEKRNLRFKLGQDGSVSKESQKLLIGQTFATDDGTRCIVTRKNYVRNHRLRDQRLHGKCITVSDDSDRLFRQFLSFCTERLSLRKPLFSPNPLRVRRIVRGPPGTGKTHALVEDALKLASGSKSVLILCPKNVNCLEVYRRLLKREADVKLVVMRSYREHWHEPEYSGISFEQAIPPMKKGAIVVAVTEVYLFSQKGKGIPNHVLWDEASLQPGVLLDVMRPSAWDACHGMYGDDLQMKPFGKDLKSVFDAALIAAPRAVETFATTYRVGPNEVWRSIFQKVYGVEPSFRGGHETAFSFEFTDDKDAQTTSAVKTARAWGTDTTVLCVSRSHRDTLQTHLPGHVVMTIFKSQGEEWKKVVVCFEIHQRLDDASRVVALTRATERCRVCVPNAWRDDGMPGGKCRFRDVGRIQNAEDKNPRRKS